MNMHESRFDIRRVYVRLRFLEDDDEILNVHTRDPFALELIDGTSLAVDKRAIHIVNRR